MASTVSLLSQPLPNFSMTVSPVKIASSSVSHYPKVVDSSEKKSTAFNEKPKLEIKFRMKSNNGTASNAVDQIVANAKSDGEALKVETSGKDSTASEDCEKLETSEKKSRVSSRGKQNKKKRIADVENQTLAAPGKNSGGKEKRKFCISLTEEEIEADIMAMGGSKRPRRIKKEPRSVQKVLDNLFPGLRLKYITADDYKVPDTP
ncbi:hypothetical protein Patl1_00135 [Pistacia atlantica]|uniref:Uncharacterized protein n=1 Tax=Pistacia atlantica TaxID=434234 RepID=A0ACC1C4F9_9ROSI|nr:hypothetical protein Patl1_00135 [Pistacia atlantica]